MDKGVSESEPNTEPVEPNEEELANNVPKIPGSLHRGVEDMNDWLNCDRDDRGYHIVTDDKTVGNLRSEEVTADDNEYDIDEEKDKVPSHSDAYQVLDLAITWMEQQEECNCFR